MNIRSKFKRGGARKHIRRAMKTLYTLFCQTYPHVCYTMMFLSTSCNLFGQQLHKNPCKFCLGTYPTTKICDLRDVPCLKEIRGKSYDLIKYYSISTIFILFQNIASLCPLQEHQIQIPSPFLTKRKTYADVCPNATVHLTG